MVMANELTCEDNMEIRTFGDSVLRGVGKRSVFGLGNWVMRNAATGIARELSGELNDRKLSARELEQRIECLMVLRLLHFWGNSVPEKN